MAWIHRNYGLHLRFRWPGVFKQLKNGWIVFLSSVITTLYANTNIFLLGLFSDAKSTGYFVGASKLIYGAIYLIFVPFSLLIYPKISAAMNKQKDHGIVLLKQATWIAFFMGLGLSTALFVASKWIIFFLYGAAFEPAVVDFKILSALPLLLSLGNMFVVQGMLNLKMDKPFLALTAASAVAGIIFCVSFNYFFVSFHHDVTAALALICTETLITAAGFVIINRKIGNPFDVAELNGLVHRTKSFRRSVTPKRLRSKQIA